MTLLSLMALALIVAILSDVCFHALALFRAVPGVARCSDQISQSTLRKQRLYENKRKKAASSLAQKVSLSTKTEEKLQ